MNGKKATDKVSNIVYVLIIIAIVLIVNALANRFFGRLDLSQNKLYSISQTTKQILSDLDDVISVKAYFSKKLPVQISRLPKEVDDMLQEYNIYSHGNVNYQRIDPGEDEELKQKLAGLGVMPVTMTIIEKDERQQINGYLGITISYGEKTEVIPMVENTQDLEYELTSRIYRVTATQPKHLGFITSNTSHDLMGDYRLFAQEVRKLHEIDPVELGEGKKVPEEINTLVLAGPTDSIPEDVKFALDQFIMRGGRIIFLIDNLVVDERRVPRQVNHGLSQMLASYGFRMSGNIVRDDKSHSNERVSQGIFTINRPNPFFLRITKKYFGEHPVVARLSELTLPWSGSLEPPVNTDSTVTYSVLARTTDAAQSFAPPRFQPLGGGNEIPLAILATGWFTSAFRNRTDLAKEGETPIDRSTAETEIMVIPCSAFLQNQYLYPGNLEFILNAIDYLTIGDKLISIRTRPTTDRPLKALSAEMKNFLRSLNIVGVPILVILFGSMRFYLKRRDKMIRSRSF